MNNSQMQVAEWMKVFGQEVRATPGLPKKEIRELRYRLIQEELNELSAAFAMDYLIGVADAIADLLYVVYGTAVACGLDGEKLMSEVHRSNMSKFWTNSEVAVEFGMDAQLAHQYNDYNKGVENDNLIAQKISKTRWIVKDKEGKVIKSPSYSPPKLENFLL